MPPLSSTPIQFGRFVVTSQVFHLTPLSYAFVNLKPLLPGHVLVSPRRVVPRLSDLSSDEVSDLFLAVQHVGRMVERVFKASSLNIALQDGVDAGQSVPHVHCHIIPRMAQDLEKDQIYDRLEGEDGDVGAYLEDRDNARQKARPKFPKVDDAGREPRSEEEMVKEAKWFRDEIEKEVGGKSTASL